MQLFKAAEKSSFRDILAAMSLDEVEEALRLLQLEHDQRTGKRKFQLPEHVLKML